MTKQTVILLTLVGYKVVLLALGWIAHKRTKDEADYFLGGRSLGPWVASLSASASSSSAWTLLGVSGAAYAWGLSAIWLLPACIGGFALNWYVLAGPLQQRSLETDALTTTELLAGDKSHKLYQAITVIASVIVIFSLTAYVASQFQGAGKAFHKTFHVSEASSVWIGSGIVIAYTLLGGFWAVSLTDTLQGLVMALTAIVLPVAAFVGVGGWEGLTAGLAKVAIPGYNAWLGDRSVWMGLFFVAGILGIGLGYPGQPHVVNRFMALANSPGAVAKARRIAMSWAVIVYTGMFVLGLCGRVMVSQLGDKEVIFLHLADQLFHPVIAGIMLAAVLSAIMSTADSQLLVAASAVAHDLMPPTERPASTVLRARLVVLGLSLCGVLMALYGSKEIFSSVLFAWTAMGSAFGPLLLYTALRGPVPPRNTIAAMVTGFGLSVLFYSMASTKGTAIERVVPFLVSSACIFLPLHPRRESSEGE